MTFIHPHVSNAIAEELGFPNEWIVADQEYDDILWFHIKDGQRYTCRTVLSGTRLKKNSIRLDN